MAEEKRTGGCLCGGVRFEMTGEMSDVVYCHCSMCRKTTGHVHAGTGGLKENFTLTKSDTLKWYTSSPDIRRGFCSTCGGNLFFDPEKKAHISICAGMLDEPTGIGEREHIFAEDKGDYYEITGPLKVNAKWYEK